jgi:polyisoprenyl-phosphate glycosyltransferase
MKSNSFVSVVFVIEKKLYAIKTVLQTVQNELESNYSDYEIVIIGNSSITSFSSQDEYVLQNIGCIRYVQLTQQVHSDVAWAVGLENAIGDFVVLFNPYTDPDKVISESVSLCKSGYDVVVGVANQSRTLSYKMFRSMADGVLRLVDYSLPQNATTLRCLSRRAVNSVTSTGRFHHQLSMRIQKTGYPQTIYKYILLQSRPIFTPRSFSMGIRDLMRLVVFNSSRPLRWMSMMGLTGSLMAFLFAVYSVLIHLLQGHVVEGWTTTILFISALFMMQFIMMAFFGEYLGRLLDDRSEQADNSVVFEKNSAVMVNQDRLNVFYSTHNTENNLVQTGRDC